MGKIIYRHIEPDELPDLLALYKQLHPADLPPPEPERLHKLWQQILDDPSKHLLVAESDKKIIASCVLVVISNLTRGGGPYGLIENVITDTDYRKKGFGTGLLKYAQQIAWDKGCYKIMLLTGRQQPEIFGFYEKAGFKRGVKTGFIIKPEDAK
ncbi:MAG: GNAT family N-acetyltransferase [Dehalococcoidales bacterium]|nr:GNAT family N-acetyltransferase [Dehalococcoidales bacterium]